MDFHNLRVGVVFQNLLSTPSSEQHINFYNYSLVPGSKRERKADQEKLHVNRIGAGERRRSGACNNLRSGSIFVLLCNNIPAGIAKRKQSLIQTFYETSAAHFFDWLTFAESANQNYFRCLFF